MDCSERTLPLVMGKFAEYCFGFISQGIFGEYCFAELVVNFTDGGNYQCG